MTRAETIRALCALAYTKDEDLVTVLTDSDLSVDAVRRLLLEVSGLLDRATDWRLSTPIPTNHLRWVPVAILQRIEALLTAAVADARRR